MKITSEDRVRFQKLIAKVKSLRVTNPQEARQLEVEICRQGLKDLEAMVPADVDEAVHFEETRETLQCIIAGEARLEDAFPGPRYRGQVVFMELSEFEKLEVIAIALERLARSARGKCRKEMEDVCASALDLREALMMRFYPGLLRMAFPEATFVEGVETLQ